MIQTYDIYSRDRLVGPSMGGYYHIIHEQLNTTYT